MKSAIASLRKNPFLEELTLFSIEPDYDPFQREFHANRHLQSEMIAIFYDNSQEEKERADIALNIIRHGKLNFCLKNRIFLFQFSKAKTLAMTVST